MENNAENFVNNFKKWVDMIVENQPKWLCYWIFIYARDTNVRTENQPDWVISFQSVLRLNNYDKVTFKDMICDDLFLCVNKL